MKIASAMQAFVLDSETPSAQIGIMEHGKVVYTAAFGKAKLNPSIRATTSMPYRIGSVSKQFTPAATMVLVEQGKLELDGPVAIWFPDLARSQEGGMQGLQYTVTGSSGKKIGASTYVTKVGKLDQLVLRKMNS